MLSGRLYELLVLTQFLLSDRIRNLRPCVKLDLKAEQDTKAGLYLAHFSSHPIL